jgi:hypothetical protein
VLDRYLKLQVQHGTKNNSYATYVERHAKGKGKERKGKGNGKGKGKNDKKGGKTPNYFIGDCENCGEKGTEVHHLQHQKKAALGLLGECLFLKEYVSIGTVVEPVSSRLGRCRLDS